MFGKKKSTIKKAKMAKAFVNEGPIWVQQNNSELMTDDCDGEEDMKENYELAKEIVKDRLAAEDTANADIISSVDKHDVINVPGCYDHIHRILGDMPHTTVHKENLAQANFRPDQTMYINCGSAEYSQAEVAAVRKFVEQGGLLITTDWALKNVIEKAFPGYVRWNKKTTGDECVAVKIRPAGEKDEVLLGFMDERSDPVWWLEGSSYPIEVLKKDAVEVLIDSEEMKKKYGSAPVVVKFKFGQGEVYHMLSHFYLQKSETRTQENVEEYLDSKWVGQSAEKRGRASEMIKKAKGKVSYNAVQSAVTSSEVVYRSVLKQKKKVSA